MAEALSDHLTLIAPDMIGHGRAPDWDVRQDYHDQATDAVERILPDAPFHLIGHSFGATVALRLAQTHLDRVKTLTLIEPVLFAAAKGRPGEVAARAALTEMGPALDRGAWPEAAAHFLDLWGGGTAFADMPAAQQRYMAERIRLIRASDPALHEDRARLLTRLEAVTMPTLLLSGGASPSVISEILDRLEDGIRDTRRAVVPGAGHMVPITHAEPVAAEIAELIRGV